MSSLRLDVCSSAEENPIRTTMNNSASSTSHERTSKPPARGLTVYGLMAEKHWREFRPKMVAKLEAEGRLMEALWEAQETTLDELETITRKLEREQKLTPGQAQAIAWEMIREDHILLPPEDSND